jgi:hypothetical protein
MPIIVIEIRRKRTMMMMIMRMMMMRGWKLMVMKKDNLKSYPQISMKVMVVEIRRRRRMMMIMTGLSAMMMMMMMMRGWILIVMKNDNLKPYPQISMNTNREHMCVCELNLWEWIR